MKMFRVPDGSVFLSFSELVDSLQQEKRVFLCNEVWRAEHEIYVVQVFGVSLVSRWFPSSFSL